MGRTFRINGAQGDGKIVSMCGSRSEEVASDGLVISPSDVENARVPSYFSAVDPFQLASKMKTEEQIASIRANSSRKRVQAACGALQTAESRRLTVGSLPS